MQKKTFASDNYSGVHPAVMQALLQANTGHAPSYGADKFTAAAIEKFKSYFGDDIDVYLVYNGTGANVLGLQTITQSFHSILCAELAHINVDESTAPEKHLGCKLVPVTAPNGKMSVRDITHKIQRIEDQHHPQAKVISVSQSTEYATVYSRAELKSIGSLARRHGLFFHMDGSRIANAAVSLNEDFAAFTKDVGVDVLSFGGTKNGMMFGEAILVFNPELARNLKYFRKQGMQLHSKMRFIGAQFNALLTDDLWKRNATHANQMAKMLEQGLREIPGILITHPVDANGVFAIFPPQIIPALQEEHFFYVWNDRTSEVRLMCSFDTAEEEIKSFVNKLKELLTSA
jgi:threonine aldolase